MALKTGGGLRTISWVITNEQYRAIMDILERRRDEGTHVRVSQSDVAREVVAAGLGVINHGQNTVSVASDSKTGRAA